MDDPFVEEAISKAVEHSSVSAESIEEAVKRLSLLSTLEYDKVRASEAKKHGVRTSTLDRNVGYAKGGQQSKEESIVEDIQPYSGFVKLPELLEEIKLTLDRFLVLPNGASTAIAVWIASTYVYDVFHIFPKLIIFSPQKRCGKSTTLDVVDALCCRAVFSSSISPAAIFRVIEAHKPTLIIDEADTFVANRNDEMIGIINSGHAKNRAFVIRCDGDEHTTKKFSTWAPMALASIQRLQSTIMDRGVVIELRRKMVSEVKERMTSDLKEALEPLRQKLMRWSHDGSHNLKLDQVTPPTLTNDRAVDNWIPLFTVAFSAGNKWASDIEGSYRLLEDQEEELTVDIMLLQDIRMLFKTNFTKTMFSAILVEYLIGIEERPWCEWKRGQPMTANSLAKLLKPFGVKSKQIRVGDQSKKGYSLESFEDSFKRYLPEDPI